MKPLTSATEDNNMPTDDSAVWQYVRGNKVDKIIVDWVSDSAAGTVSQASKDPSGNPMVFNGRVVKITTDPGDPAPTDNYDVTLDDADGADIALGALANRHTTTTQTVYPSVVGSGGTTFFQAGAVNGQITLTIAAAGNSKKGKITIYLA